MTDEFIKRLHSIGDIKLKNLKLIREQSNYKQKDVASGVAVSQELISQWEGGRSLPSSKSINKLCDFFNCSADFLLDRTDVSTPVSDLILDNDNREYAKVIEIYKSLSDVNRKHFVSYLNYLSLVSKAK